LTSTSFYSNFHKAGQIAAGFGTNAEGNKWLGIKGGPQIRQGRGGGISHFKQKRNNSTGTTQVPIFYCEVCKISCAGPQVFRI
jgi:hypothetical protein